MVGIVRRIDELGRIVIPKEMRKTMRLQVGDEMEIFASDEGLTLKRYSGFQRALPSCRALSKALADKANADVLILSANEVVLCEGKNKKHYRGARLTSEFSNIIRNRNVELLEGENLCKIFENLDCEGSVFLSEPVLSGGDFVGCIALVCNNVTETQRDYLHFCAELISAILSE